MDGLLTTAQAAKCMKRSRRWVQDLILRGQLKAEKVGRDYVVRSEDVKQYRHQPGGRPALKKVTRQAGSPKRSKRTQPQTGGRRVTEAG